MHKAEQFNNFAQGLWKINRTIIHNNPYSHVEISGTASFSLHNDVLLYHEKANLKNLTQYETYGYRRYRYIYDQNAQKLFKYFDDGKLFYELHFENGSASGHHLCNDDTYSAKYQFLSDKNFSLSYEVQGPKKDYRILTEYVLLS